MQAFIAFLGCDQAGFLAHCQSAKIDVDQDEPSFNPADLGEQERTLAHLANRDDNGLSAGERFAIWLYSSTDAGWYSRINGELWDGNPSPATLAVAEILNSALSKLRAHDAMAFRGFNAIDLDQFMATYDVGAKIRWRGFTSSSAFPERAFEGNVYFRIRSHSGRILGNYADLPEEEEILFPSGTAFIVLAIEQREDEAIIDLEESGS